MFIGWAWYVYNDLIGRSSFAVLQVSNDPYDIEERDPAESGALESCLWELKVSVESVH